MNARQMMADAFGLTLFWCAVYGWFWLGAVIDPEPIRGEPVIVEMVRR